MRKRKPQNERAVMEVKADGTIVLMSKAQERAWRKKVKTVIRKPERGTPEGEKGL